MFRNAFTGLIAAALCLSFSAGSAHAQFKVRGKIGSISKKTGSRVSRSVKSLPKPRLSVPSPTKRVGTFKPKSPIALPKRGISLPKTPVRFPKPGAINRPKPGLGLPKPGPITLPKPPSRFPKPGIGIKNPLPIKLPKPGTGPVVLPKPGTGPIVLPKPGAGPIVPPNPEITPLPEPIKYPRPDHCWKPPHRCHWWINICAPIRICRPVDIVRCDWNYVRCDVVFAGQVVAETRWYLGVEGVFLPGKGLGIESVAEGSPAAVVGLTAGMVIVEANGIAMQTEEAMQQAIAASQGTLNVVVLSEASEQPLQGTIQMVPLASAKF